MRNRNLIVGIVLVVVIAAGGLWWWQSQTETSASDNLLEATGVIESRRVSLAPEISGKVVEVLAEEGQGVSAGQVLVKLDETAVATQRAHALAGLRAAQANLAQLKHGPTQNQLDAAEAQLAQAEANLRATEATLDSVTNGSRAEQIAAIRANLERARADYRTVQTALTADQIEKMRVALITAEGNLALAILRRDQLAKDNHNPAFIVANAEAAVVDAHAAVAAARRTWEMAADESQPHYSRLEAARFSLEGAVSNLAKAQARHSGLQADRRSTPDGLEAAKATHEDAQEQVETARVAYEALVSGISAYPADAVWAEIRRAQDQLAGFAEADQGNPGTSVEALLAQIDAASALRDVVAANLAELRSGTRSEQIEAAKAQVDAAQAQVDALDIQLEKTTITTPWDGVVLNRSVEPGEAVMAGATLLEIGRLDRLELTVYLPEDRFGHITPGQQAIVRVDAYPGRVFTGTVLRMADEAEFTPTNIQTKDDRARLVYAVVIGLDNPDLALKPGMIADAEFGR